MVNQKKRSTVAPRLISMLLALLLIVTMVPAIALATGGEESAQPATELVADLGGGEEEATNEGGDPLDEGTDPDEGSAGIEGESDGFAGIAPSMELLGAEINPLDGEITPFAASDITSLSTVVSPASFQTFDDLVPPNTVVCRVRG